MWGVCYTGKKIFHNTKQAMKKIKRYNFLGNQTIKVHSLDPESAVAGRATSGAGAQGAVYAILTH